ncbi:Peptidase C14, caspase catalytic subunit p20 [Rhodopseudomonas palustris HaA2]|uniref:Peptidase C14, caspase catalytic subunit p20 n=1 Tax=Rhodopseudomonas palustris (strain HaA2) TaxID=316058 RepID=Q2IUB4_RHOP2|nr:caspase family protein [Rhodopseudomonas palustris]ABD08196.1 Peptidase C14, caspase catalytic subunit p20 [Rhodopseudomonas palustris HaA2]
MERWAIGIALAVVAALWLSPARAEKRVALVIGNSGYQNVSRLDNPKNDAVLMAETLSVIGFTLVGGRAQLDLDKPSLDSAVQNFGRQIQGADVALFYFAGHGVQISGANYLVPVNANPTREADVDFQMVDVNVVLRQMQAAGTRLKIVILDACRNNPFGARGLRSSEGGLAQMRAPDGTLISYATQPGSVALDGGDGHSPYTRALAATVKRAGLDLFQTFNQVGLAVMRATGGAQQPWVSSSPIDGTFYFVAPALPLPPASPSPMQEARLSETPRRDPDRAPLTDAGALRELRDRLYERNFDPDVPDDKAGLRTAIAKFQEKAALPQTGEATEGVLARLRQTDDLKPWGSIVYDPDNEKWGMSWNHASRKAAVSDAGAKCSGAPCKVELSFYGQRCGAFAVSAMAWSLVDRDSVQAAKDAALSACGKSGKPCRVIGAVCADGSGR